MSATIERFSSDRRRSRETKGQPSQPDLSADAMQARLLTSLKMLDGEQLQIVQIVVKAIIRGAR